MVQLNFYYEWKDKLLSGEKKQTVRYHAEHWALHKEKGSKLQIYCPGNPYGQKIGEAKRWHVILAYGCDFTDDVAILDGFPDLDHLIGWICNWKNMTEREFNEHLWAIIRWEWRGDVSGSTDMQDVWGDVREPSRASPPQAARQL